MSSRLVCFLLEPIGEAEEALRRYVLSDGAKSRCTTGSYHNATVTIGIIPWSEPYLGRGADDFDHGDPRWPASCLCGYTFQPEDPWQHNLDQLHRGLNGAKTTIKDAPPGAMWHADWLKDIKPYSERTPDGLILVVRTPGGDWIVDGPATNGSGWTRTGTPPNVTATPSISMPGYHGFLTGGALIEV